MPRKITRQEYDSLVKVDRKLDSETAVSGRLGNYEYSNGRATSSNPETQKKLDNIMKMCSLFQAAAIDVEAAPDADKSFVLATAKIRMKSYKSQFFEGKDYNTNERHWQHDVVGDWFWDWSNFSPDFWRGHPELCYYVREVCNDLYLPLPYFANELSVGAAPGAYRDKLTDKVGDPANVDNMVALLAVKDSKDGPSRYQAMFKDWTKYEDELTGEFGNTCYEDVNPIDHAAEMWKLRRDKELMEFLKTERALQAAKEGNLETVVQVNVYMPRQRAERERQEQQDKERAEREKVQAQREEAERRERERQEYERELAEQAQAASAERSAERAPKLEAMLRKFGYTDEELAAGAPKKVGGSAEYRSMVNTLFNGYKDAKLNKYSIQNDKDIVNACIAYNKGKKSVRTFESGRERFDLSLHLMATVADPRDPDVQANIARINEVRKAKPGDPNYVDLANYGVEKAGDPTLREAEKLFDKKRDQLEGFTKEELDEIRGKIGEGLHTVRLDGKEVPDPNARLSFDEANRKINAATSAIRTRKAEAARQEAQRAADEKAAAEKQHQEELAKLEAEERVKAEAEAKRVRAAANVKINAAERAVQNEKVIEQVNEDVETFRKKLADEKKALAIEERKAVIEEKWRNFDEKSFSAAGPGDKACNFVKSCLKQGHERIITTPNYSTAVYYSNGRGTGAQLDAHVSAIKAILMTKLVGPEDPIPVGMKEKLDKVAHQMAHKEVKDEGHTKKLFYSTGLDQFNNEYGFLSAARRNEDTRKAETMVLYHYNDMVEKGEIEPLLPAGAEIDPISGADVHKFLSDKGAEAVKQFKELEKDHNPENPMTPEMIRAHETAVRYCVADNILKQRYPNAKGAVDVEDVMKKADEFIKRPSMLNALGSLPLDQNFNLAIGKVCIMDMQKTAEQSIEANKRMTAEYGAPEKKEEGPAVGK